MINLGKKYDLVTIDLDGTITPVITEEYLLKALAPDRLSKYHEWEELLRKDYENYFEKATTEQFKLLVGLRYSDIKGVMKQLPLAKNIDKAVQLLNEYGFKVVILTDNIDVFCEGISERVPIKEYISSKTIVKDDIIVGLKELNLRKEMGLKVYLERNNIDPKRVIHIGDWKNDIPVFNSVGFGIAYMPKEQEVVNEAHLTINIDDFLKVARLIIAIDKC